MALLATHIGGFTFQEEAAFGAGFPGSGQLEIPGDAITSATLTPGSNAKRLPTINDYDYAATVWGAVELAVNLECQFQRLETTGQRQATTCLEYYATSRTNGDMTKSIAAAVKTGASGSVYFILAGGKVNQQTITFTNGMPVGVASELWFTTLSTAQAAPAGTGASALGRVFDTFHTSLFTRTAKWTSGIKSATLTINNHLERIPKIATSSAQGNTYAYILPGIQETTLTVDIIADGGGHADLADLLAFDKTNLVLQTGTTAGKSCKWTLTNPSYNSTPVPYQADMSSLIINASMGAESVAFAAV